MRRTVQIYGALGALVIGGLGIVTPPVAASGQADYAIDGCTRADLGGHSVARVWDDALLELIRQVVPAPTVHARNLFHTSVAMWDAWAAFDPEADGYLVTEKVAAPMTSRRHGRRRSAMPSTASCSGATARSRISRSPPSSSTR